MFTKRRRIYLMRHGEVSYFDEQGKPVRPDSVPLNAEGQAQAKAAAQCLADAPIDRVITSPLPRTIETARIVLAGRELPHAIEPQFEEIRPGKLADIPVDKLRHNFLGAFSASVERDHPFLGGETIGSMVDRVTGRFAEILADESWSALLIVAHGGVNRAILGHALAVGGSGIPRIEQDACCVNIIDVDQHGHFLVRLVNHSPYNPAKLGLHLTTMEKLLHDYVTARGGA